MDGLRISEAAAAVGFTASALRFYEKEGVVVPGRTPSGYRVYGDDHVESLRFVARGKQLGLRLEEVTELLELFDHEDCAPVQTRIRHLVDDRIRQARAKIAELVAFISQLQTAAARLGVHTPHGACDAACGCRSDPSQPTGVDEDRSIPLAGSISHEIACSLQADSVAERVRDWGGVISKAIGGTKVPGGIQVVFDRDVDVAALAHLAAAEQACCSFSHCDIAIGSREVTLDVTGPDETLEVIATLFGLAV